MGYLAAYNTSSFSGSLDRGNINIAISSSIFSGSTGAIRFGDISFPPSGGMIIVSDSNTQLGIASASATPLFWKINDLTDTASILNTINALPERVNQTRFTTTSSAYLYLVSSSKYFPILGTEPLNTIVTDGLLMYLDAGQLVSYPTTASSWYDISGNNNSGSLLNGTSYNNGAIVFDGVDDYVAIRNNINPSNITLEFTYIDTVSSSYEYLISNARDCCGAYNGYELRVNNGFPRFSIWNSSSFDIQSPQRILLNKVYHLVASYNGTQSKIYQNGVLIVTGSSTLGIGNPPSYNLAIGGMGLNPATYNMQGKIYNSKVYNRELSQSEILQNYYQGPIVTNGLVMALDAGNLVSYESGSTTTYSLTGSISGSLVNGTGYNNGNGGSWVFDGVDDYINNIGTTSSFSFIQNTGIFTISSWVRLTDLSVARYFLGNNDGTTGAKGFYLGHRGTPGQLWMAITYGIGGQTTISLIRDNFFTDNNWVFVTCVGNGTTCQFYKNGQIFGSSGTFGTLSTGDSTRALSVGRINDLNSSYWKGNIAQTQIYNRALTATEIQQNFNAQSNRFGF